MSHQREIARILKALAKAPDDVPLQERLGELYLKVGEDRLAAQAFARVAAAYGRDGFPLKEVALLKLSLKLFHDVAWVEQLASALARLGLKIEAEGYWNLAAEQHRRTGALDRLDAVIAKLRSLHDDM